MSIKRHKAFLYLLVAGLLGWFLGSATLGDVYAFAIGPDFVARIPVKLIHAAAALWLYRFIIAERFPTIDAFTRRGTKERSDFQRVWETPGGSHDPRLWISVATHLGVLAIVILLLAL